MSAGGRSVSDLHVDPLSALGGGCLDDRTDGLGDAAVTADDHAHVVGGDREGQGDGSFILLTDDLDLVGAIYDGGSDVV